MFSGATMKKLAIAIAVAGLVGTPAFAADIAANPPPSLLPVPVYSWTGWYVGGDLGGIWGGDPINLSTTNLQFCGGAGCPVGGLASAVASAQGTTGVFSGNNHGVIGGGQLGYNWQFANWLAGLEADFQGVSDRLTETSKSTFGVVGFPGSTIATALSVEKELDYFGTVRGRLSWLPNPQLLVYGTGGLAYGGAKSSLTVNQTLTNLGGAVQSNPSANGGISQMRTGWTAGGGIEWMPAPQWSVKLEYLYYDLGSVTYNALLVDGCIACSGQPFFTNNVQTTMRFNGNIVRLGLNYHPW
jgi:outer membrane immunogenic protein